MFSEFSFIFNFFFQVNVVLLQLTTSQGLDSVSQLYENHIQEFLDKLKASADQDSVVCVFTLYDFKWRPCIVF